MVDATAVPVGRPDARLRRGVDSERGIPVRFLYRLEYRIEHDDAPDEWVPVAQFDHNPEGTYGHDVAEEGLHMDVYRGGEKHHVVRGFPPVSLRGAPSYANTYLRENADRLIRELNEWRNQNPTTD